MDDTNPDQLLKLATTSTVLSGHARRRWPDGATGMRAAVEILLGILLVVALVGLTLVVIGLARGGVSKVPAIGIILLVVAGAPVATRLAAARRGLARMWGRFRP